MNLLASSSKKHKSDKKKSSRGKRAQGQAADGDDAEWSEWAWDSSRRKEYRHRQKNGEASIGCLFFIQLFITAAVESWLTHALI
jgi:hypothetical protein